MTRRRTHQDKAHWQKLVDQQARSGLSGAQFCRQENVRYASFMGWRKRLQVPTPQPSPMAPGAFVELTAPAKTSPEPHPKPSSDTNLCLELSLGAGIELRITRTS
jgi:hypothetical protein